MDVVTVATFPRTVAVLLLSLGVSGCFAKATAYQGKFTFAYASGLDAVNFVKPIAPGAKLEVVAFTNGTEEEMVVTKATSSQRRVVAVESVDGHAIVLRGGEPGVAEIEITARDEAGRLLVDKMFFHVAKPATHGLGHACTDAPAAAYVRGDDVVVFHDLKTADKRAVIGFGYAPIAIEPAGALELVPQPQGSSVYRLRAKGAIERATIRSQVDGEVLSLRLVDRKELSEASLRVPEMVLEGKSQYAIADVHFGEVPLCSQRALTRARSLTPDICDVTARLDDEPGEQNHDQLALVQGRKLGVCAFEITLPELADGRGITLSGKTRIGRIELPPDDAYLRSYREVIGLATAFWVPRLAVLAGFLLWRWRRRRRA